MSLKIRLSRGGSTHNPHYKIVVIESRKARDGQPVENIGHYHPKQTESKVSIDANRFSYWVQNGATPTNIVAKLACQLSIDAAKKFRPTFVVTGKEGKSKKDLKTLASK